MKNIATMKYISNKLSLTNISKKTLVLTYFFDKESKGRDLQGAAFQPWMESRAEKVYLLWFNSLREK